MKLYLREHRLQGQQNWHKAVDIGACVVQKQQGFICGSKPLTTQDICLTLNKLFVILKCILMKPQNCTCIYWN